MIKKLIGLACLLLVACGGPSESTSTIAGGGAIPDNGLLLVYTAEEENGTCIPRREDYGDLGESAMRNYRGETRFILPAGTTQIPFQSILKYPGDDGIARDTAITGLNHSGSCDQLRIEIVVSECELMTDQGRERSACPGEITIEGGENFASVELSRADLDEG